METPVVLELPNPNFITTLNGLWTLLLLLLLAAIAAASFAKTRTTTKKLLISRILFSSGKSVNTTLSSYCFSDCSSDEEEEEDDDDESYPSDDDDDYGSDEENHGEERESKLGQYCNFHEPDFDWQNSVVKFWEGLDFGLGSGSGDPTRLTAEADRGGNVAVRVWDSRASPPSESAAPPAAVATWRTVRGREEEKVVYVGGGGGGGVNQVRERLTVVDLRNVKTTLGELRRQCWSDGVTMANGEGSELNMIDWLLFPK